MGSQQNREGTKASFAGGLPYDIHGLGVVPLPQECTETSSFYFLDNISMGWRGLEAGSPSDEMRALAGTSPDGSLHTAMPVTHERWA